MIFYMNEISTQIISEYKTLKYNFYQNDSISYEMLGSYSAFVSESGIMEDWADRRTYNEETCSYDTYYNYMYTYRINIRGEKTIDLKITSENELSNEKLDEIIQLFIDNIVIINTEE